MYIFCMCRYWGTCIYENCSGYLGNVFLSIYLFAVIGCWAWNEIGVCLYYFCVGLPILYLLQFFDLMPGCVLSVERHCWRAGAAARRMQPREPKPTIVFSFFYHWCQVAGLHGMRHARIPPNSTSYLLPCDAPCPGSSICTHSVTSEVAFSHFYSDFTPHQ